MEVQLSRVIKTYDLRTVLNIEALTFEKGRIHGIIGPNGAGKSTMLKIIAGLETQTQGTVLYDGQVFNAQLLKEMTYMSQHHYLLRTSVYHNVAYPLKLRKVPKEEIQEKVEAILKEFGLYELRHQLATSLSGGEAQKVALARALIFEPKLLLLDEPTANIEPHSIDFIEKAIIKRNHEQYMTIITITHNMEQANRLCHQLVRIEDGKHSLFK